MKMTTPKMLAAALLLLAAATGAEAAEKVAGYETFKLVRTRNIFDPNRKAVRVDPTAGQRASTAKQSRTSSFTLTGTMDADGRTLAFFNGTRADYRKVLKVGETIADGKVTAIKATEIELERGGKTVVLAIGQQLQIDSLPSDAPAEEPAAAPAESDPPADGAAPAPGAAPAGASPPSAPATEANDVLRRMMERRQKEMSK